MDWTKYAELDEELGKLLKASQTELEAIAIADDEIDKARKEHGEEDEGQISASLPLLSPTHPRMEMEFVYRSHCRELLERRSQGKDTRRATAAECALAMAEISKKIPMHGGVAGIYFRLLTQAFPEEAEKLFGDAAVQVKDFEKLFRTEMDDHERLLRYKLRQNWRTLRTSDERPTSATTAARNPPQPRLSSEPD